jgi:transcriptional regulator with XRE-family HTH domain
MFSFRKAIKNPEYWLNGIQNDLFNQLNTYLAATKKSKGELATEMGVSNAYISQILNGNFNFTLKKLLEIGLHIGKVPVITFVAFDDLIAEHEAKKALLNSQRAAFISLGQEEVITKLPTYSISTPIENSLTTIQSGCAVA